MFYPPRLYFRDRWISLPFVVSAVLVLFMVWYTVSKIAPSDEQFFLHYNILYGVDLIGEWWKLYLMPFGALGIFLVNLLVSYFFYEKNRFISRIVSTMTAGLEVFLLIGCLLVIGLNI